MKYYPRPTCSSAGLTALLAVFLFACLAASPAWADGMGGPTGQQGIDQTGPGSKAPARFEEKPPAVRDLDIIDHRGDTLPKDLIFKDSTGKTVKLKDVIKPGIPVIFDFEYFTCPVLCPLVQNGIADAVKEMGWKPGKQFQIITVSIDPRDTPKAAAKKKFGALHRAGYPEATDGWRFLTGMEPQIKKLTKAAGFQYRFLPDRAQFAHLAVIMVLTDKGKISRYLYGVKYPAQTLRLSLVEASNGNVGSALDKILLCCFSYNESEGKYAATAKFLMTMGGAVTVVVLSAVLGMAFYFEARGRKNRQENGEGPHGPAANDAHSNYPNDPSAASTP